MNKDGIKKAIALKYPKDFDAPFICANEKGFLAKRLVELAKENDVPVVEDVLLANILSAEEVGSMIPESTWQALAVIFAFVVKAESRN